MFEVGFTEIVLILGLALLVLGPEKLPGLAEKVGRWTGRARAMARQLRTQLEQEVNLDDLAKSRPSQTSGTASAGFSASAAQDTDETPAPADESPEVHGSADPELDPGEASCTAYAPEEPAPVEDAPAKDQTR